MQQNHHHETRPRRSEEMKRGYKIFKEPETPRNQKESKKILQEQKPQRQ